jgi:hypothetical protein
MNVTDVGNYMGAGGALRYLIPGIVHKVRVWYGVARTPTRLIPVVQRTTVVGFVWSTDSGKGTRFEMDPDALDESPYWRALPSGWK